MNTQSSGTNSRTERTVYSVSRVNQDVNQLLESQIGMLWIEGELSNFSRPASGHFYFSLKDSRAQLRCAMFKGRNRYLDFTPDNGDQVLVRGKLGVYEARGDFQLIVEHMEPAGAGLLQKRFDEIKQKLQLEGLFDAEQKKPLPAWPDTIGVITSPTGAAIRDIVQVLKRRYSRAQIIIYPTLVQGAAAALPICQAIDQAVTRSECDVLILSRGGGSLEDLWAFNDERVARRIADCPLPLIAGIGHEIDFTIADMVADQRAPTPSAAAELCAPDSQAAATRVKALVSRLQRAQLQRITPARTLINQLTMRLQSRHPKRVLTQQMLRTDELEARLKQAILALRDRQRLRLGVAIPKLHLYSPARRVEQKQTHVTALRLQLETLAHANLNEATSKLATLSRALNTVSPLATLSRGYSVIRKEGKIVTDAQKFKPGDTLDAQMAKGRIIAEIQTIDTDKNSPR